MSSDTPDPARCADELSSSLPAGTVYPPGTDQYATSTSPDNTSFAQHPDAVVCPRTTEDVAATVALARNLGLRVGVQATEGAAVHDPLHHEQVRRARHGQGLRGRARQAQHPSNALTGPPGLCSPSADQHRPWRDPPARPEAAGLTARLWGPLGGGRGRRRARATDRLGLRRTMPPARPRPQSRRCGRSSGRPIRSRRVPRS